MTLLQRIGFCWRILRQPEGNLLRHAIRELPPADGDEMQEFMNRNLCELLLAFSTQGHSGFSAGYATAALEKLLKFEPLRPLSGEASEWNEVSEGLWQNNRCSHVFKDADGRAYDIDGKVFREPNGACFTNFDSRVYITFPYVPRKEYVDVGPR